jgi:hypothetical protein
MLRQFRIPFIYPLREELPETRPLKSRGELGAAYRRTPEQSKLLGKPIQCFVDDLTFDS